MVRIDFEENIQVSNMERCIGQAGVCEGSPDYNMVVDKNGQTNRYPVCADCGNRTLRKFGLPVLQ